MSSNVFKNHRKICREGEGSNYLAETQQNTKKDTPAPKTIVPPTDNINLCFVGGVSTGKSTILNAIFCEELTQCKIKRTTMVPTIYIENESNPFHITQPEEIYQQIVAKNTEIIAKTERGEPISPSEYTELVFNVGKLDINILQDAYVNVYDIPGLNDARTKDVYYSYLDTNFHKFNLIVLIVDIHSGLNTSDEIDIVNFVANSIREQLNTHNRKIYTMVVVNKADDMQLDDADNLTLTGELNEMYEQVEQTIRGEFDRRDINEHLIGIIPLCALDAYLYRMVQKHGKEFKLSPEQILKIGINENGKKFSTLKPAVQEKKVYEILEDREFIQTMIKLSGFASVEKVLHEFLSQNNTGSRIRVQNLLQQLQQLPDMLEYMKATHPTDWPPIGSELLSASSGKIFAQTFELMGRIRKIDEEQYKELMENIISRIKAIVAAHIKVCGSLGEVSNCWSAFQRCVAPYISEMMDTDTTPPYVKDRVKILATELVEQANVITIENILRIMESYQRFELFERNSVSELLEKMMKRIGDAEHRYCEPEEENDLQEMIVLLEDINCLGVDIVRFVRFLVIYRMITQRCGRETMMKKQMFYQIHGEIYVYNLLVNTTAKLDYTDMRMLFIDGLNDAELVGKEYELDRYYITLIE